MGFESTITIISLVGPSVLLPTGFFGFTTFDRILKRLYNEYREQWEAVGKPRTVLYLEHPGSIWTFRTEMSKVFDDCKRTLIAVGLLYVWLFVTPKWVKGDSIARRMLLQVRIALGVFVSGVIILLAIIKAAAMAHGVPFPPDT